MKSVSLFDGSSTNEVSLTHFEIIEQVTITAVGMQEGEYVTFEMVTISSPTHQVSCDPCELPPVVMPEATAWQPLTCCSEEHVSLSSAHPVLILDAPTGMRIRALYHGHNFSLGNPFTADVTLRESKVKSIHESMRGCCQPVSPGCMDCSAAPEGAVTGITASSVTVTLAEAADVIVRTLAGTVVGQQPAVFGAFTFTSLPSDSLLYITTTNSCGLSTTRGTKTLAA